jgi:hypothetical protein
MRLARRIRTRDVARLGYTKHVKTFKLYTPDQLFLLPPALRDWLPEGHLALFVSTVVDALDFAPIRRPASPCRRRPRPMRATSAPPR